MLVFELELIWKNIVQKSKQEYTHAYTQTHIQYGIGFWHKWPPTGCLKRGDVMSVMEAVSLYRWSISYPAVLCAT